MKVLFYSHSSTLYGAPSSLANLITGFQRDYPELESMVIIPSNGPLYGELKRLNIPCKVIPHYKWNYNYSTYATKKKQSLILAFLWLIKNVFTRTFKNFFHFLQHVKFCKEFKPDVVYVNSCTAPMGLWVGLWCKIKIVCHHRETINDPVTGWYLDFGKSFCSVFLKRAWLHIFPSRYLQSTYQWLHGRKRDCVVFNGVYFRHSFAKRKSEFANLKKLRFSMIGRISEQKGQEEVINFFNELLHTELSLSIYGAGMHDYVESLKLKTKNRNIKFEGFKDRDYIYEHTDFVIFNAKNESFGRVIAEANAYGIPVMAVASGALSEIVENGVNGYAFESFEKFKSFFLLEILNGDKLNYTALSDSAQRFFMDKFSIEAYAETIFNELKSLGEIKNKV